MLSVQQFRMFDFAFCILIKCLVFPLYWDLSSFCATIYLKYFFLFKYQPLISSFLPQVSSSLLVSSFLYMTFALINVPVLPLVFYLFTVSNDLRSEKEKTGQIAHFRQQTGCYSPLSELVADMLLLKTCLQTFNSS